MKQPEILTYWPSLILQIRTYLNLSQEDLADMVESNQATVSRWEKGVVIPSYEKQKKIELIASEANISSLGGVVELVRNSPSRIFVVDEDNFVIASSKSSEWLESADVQEQLSINANPHFEIVAGTLKEAGFWAGVGGLVMEYDFDDGARVWHSVITSVSIRGRIYAIIQQTVS